MTLREYLEEEGLTETAFAELLGISQAAVNRYCNGIRTPHKTKLRAIVDATGGKVTANDFMEAE